MTEISVSYANQPGARLDVDDDTYKPPPGCTTDSTDRGRYRLERTMTPSEGIA